LVISLWVEVYKSPKVCHRDIMNVLKAKIEKYTVTNMKIL